MNGTQNFNIISTPFNESDDIVQSLLEICPVEPEHAGTYTCQALNMYGNDSVFVELIVDEGNNKKTFNSSQSNQKHAPSKMISSLHKWYEVTYGQTANY